MLYIAHRGCINGPNPDRENHPDFLLEAVNSGFQVEVDVWYLDNKFYLGHDEPQYETNLEFINNLNFWCHAKNIEALSQLMETNIQCFFHDSDECTLTSHNWIWTYPGKTIVSKRAIAVMPERIPDWDFSQAGGICSDFVLNYRNKDPFYQF